MRGVAVIGCGLIGRTHALVIKGLSDAGLIAASLVVACDVDEERARTLADELSIPAVFADSAAAMDHPDVDVVYVCTPTREHAPLVDAVASRGHALFCEKPLARSAAEARAMQAVVERAGIPAQVGLVLRYSAVFGEVRALLRGEAEVRDAGRPMAATFRDDQGFPVDGLYGSRWRADAAVAGGGTLIEHSIHDVDLLRWILGDVTRVSAHTRHFAGHGGIEDVTAAVLDFAEGATATLTSVWHQIPERTSERHLEVFCERAWVQSDGDFTGTVRWQQAGAGPARLDEDDLLARWEQRSGLPPAAAPFLRSAYFTESLAFFQALSSGLPPSPGFADAVRAHAVVDAMYESARRGAPVDVPPP